MRGPLDGRHTGSSGAEDWRQVARDLLPAAVAADPDNQSTVLTLRGLAAVAAPQCQECRVHRDYLLIPVNADLFLLRCMGKGVEGRSPGAQVREAVGAGQPFAAGVDEGVFGSPEL